MSFTYGRRRLTKKTLDPVGPGSVAGGVAKQTRVEGGLDQAALDVGGGHGELGVGGLSAGDAGLSGGDGLSEGDGAVGEEGGSLGPDGLVEGKVVAGEDVGARQGAVVLDDVVLAEVVEVKGVWVAGGGGGEGDGGDEPGGGLLEADAGLQGDDELVQGDVDAGDEAVVGECVHHGTGARA